MRWPWQRGMTPPWVVGAEQAVRDAIEVIDRRCLLEADLRKLQPALANKALWPGIVAYASRSRPRS